MKSAELSKNETERIQALLDYDVLDTNAETCFDELTNLASVICETPISLVSLLDLNRQWFKSKVGIDAPETPRDIAFCAHAILQEKIFEVPNALEDSRFSDNPLVTGDPNVRFYAGVPLRSSSGHNVGTLCVIDNIPRSLTPVQKNALRVLAHQVVSQLELRKKINDVLEIGLQRESLLKDLAEKNENLDQFSYIVSHDLKAPLRAINSLSTWIREDVESLCSEEAKTHFDLLTSRISRLEGMIEGILNFSRMDRLELISENIDVGEMINTIWSDLSPDKGATLDLGKLPVISGAKQAFLHIFQNILSNSIKYCDKDVVRVGVHQNQVPGRLELVFTDNGPGIAAEYRDRVFSVFQTLQARDEYESTGVGLSIVLKLVKRTGGEVWITGEPGEGASIHVSWPETIIFGKALPQGLEEAPSL